MDIKSKARTITSGDRIIDGFTPSPLPPIAPDGGLVLSPAAPLPVVRTVSLCERGPCRHYWRAVSSIESAEPLDGSLGPEARQELHTCLPAPGIEMELNGVDIYSCSRWDPEEPAEVAAREARRQAFWATHDAEVAALVATVPDETPDPTEAGEEETPL